MLNTAVTTYLFRKKTSQKYKHEILFLLKFFLCLLLFTGCKNLFSPHSSSPSKNSTEKQKTVTVSGVFIEGSTFQKKVKSLPASLQTSDNSKLTASRTVFPTLPSSGIVYSVKAENTAPGSTEVYTGNVINNSSYTIAIPFKDVTATYKIKVSVTYNNVIILQGQSEPFTITYNEQIFQKNITINAAQTTGGKGCIGLSVTADADSGINSAKLFYTENSTAKTVTATTVTATTSGTTFTFSAGQISDGTVTDGITSGSYNVCFEFYKSTNCSGTSAYAFTEVINIFDNLISDTWIQNGDEPYFSTTTDPNGNTTSCRITKAMTDNFILTDIYIDETAATTNESGTFINPCKTFNTALSKLTDSSKDYKFYIKGTLTGTQIIPDTLKKTGSGGSYTYAKSLTLCGATGLDTDGNPQDSLNGNNGGTVLTINTEVPVIIKNLKIYGGYTSESGGGIVAITGTNLTLERGALIGKPANNTTPSKTNNGNRALVKAGGIYSEGTLTLKNGSGVIFNYADNSEGTTEGNTGGIYSKNGSLTIENGAKINWNSSAAEGGGITLDGSAFNMTGGEICNNLSINGAGGIVIKTCSSSMTISGAVISDNKASNGSSGAIYHGGGQTLTITGNTVISRNNSKFEGGAIRVAPGILELIDCTISDNYSNNGTRAGGGIAANAGGSIKLGGSVYIPSGANVNGTFKTGMGCNDIRQNYGAIIILGKLIPPEEANGIVATITPNGYENGKQLLALADGVTDTTLAEEVSKFTVTPVEGENWIIKNTGYLANQPTAAAAITTLENMTESGTIEIAGPITDSEFTQLKTALTELASSNSSVLIDLDLSNAEITTIPNEAFQGCTNIKSVHFPEGLTTIGQDAFYANNNLEIIYLPLTITEIGSFAITSNKLHNVYYPGTLEQYCLVEFKSLLFGNSDATDKNLYINGTLLEGEIEIDGSKVPKIGAGVFCNYKKLTKVTITEGCRSIEDNAFYRSSINEVVFPPEMDSLGDDVFSSSNITSLSIPEGIEELGQIFIRWTYSLTYVRLPNSLKKIDDDFDSFSINTVEGNIEGWKDDNGQTFTITADALKGDDDSHPFPWTHD